MAAYLILIPAIFSCFFFSLASQNEQNSNHNLLIRELHDAKLKISRLGKTFPLNFFANKYYYMKTHINLDLDSVLVVNWTQNPFLRKAFKT